MLTLKQKYGNKPNILIAKVAGGELDGMEVYINPDIDEQKIKRLIAKQQSGKANSSNNNSSNNNSSNNNSSNNNSSNNKYKKLLKQYANKFELTDEQMDSGSKLEYHMNGPFRDCLFVAGTSGSGKSYLTGDLIKRWRKRWCDKDNYQYNLKLNKDCKKPYQFVGRTYLFSPKEYDEPLDKQQIFRIDINDKNLINENTKLNFKDFSPGLVVFDDVEAMPRKYQIACRELLDGILKGGRSYQISAINIGHDMYGSKDTKATMSECPAFVMFPKTGLEVQYRRVLKDKLGYRPEEVDVIMDLPVDRYFIVNKEHPKYIFTESAVYTPQYIKEEAKKLKKERNIERMKERYIARERFKKQVLESAIKPNSNNSTEISSESEEEYL